MSMKGKLGLLAMTAALIGGGFGMDNERNSIRPEDIDTTPKEPVIPKGCSQYFFNKNGGYNTVKDSYTVFVCIASNYKSAKKKFNKWYASNSQSVV
jgi:hypothetical protein